MAIKFSQFSESTSTSQVDFIVGYDGNQNVRITPSNFLAVLGDYLPLTGGTLTGNLTAPAFIKTGGTSSEFLKADGTVDTNTYLTTTTGDVRYVELSGDTMTGDLTIQKINPVFELNSNSIYPYCKIEFAGSTYQPYEIVAQNNPSTSGLALRGDASGTMTDAFLVKSFSGSLYNYSAVPLRIGADATANELDDYEEGTFDLEWGYANFGGITFYDLSDFGGNKSETSRYVKVGRHVTVTSIFRWGTLPTAWTDTAALVYLKLPFTVSSGYYGNGTYYMFPGSTSAGSPSLFPIGYSVASSLLGMHKNTVGFYNNFQTLQVGDLPGIGPSGYVEVRLSFSFYTTD